MTIRCPKCATPSALSADQVGFAGRLVRCERCGTSWLARHLAADAYAPPAGRAPRPLLRKQPQIIEGEIVATSRRRAEPGPASRAATGPAPRPAAERAGWSGAFVIAPAPRPVPATLRRYGLPAGAAVLGALLLAVLALSPGVSALPGVFAPRGSISLEGIESRTLTHRGAEALLVEGRLVNATDREMAVPAIRISLAASAGGEVYSWLVEPARARLAAGGSLGFRSALANPVPGASHVAASLAERAAFATDAR